MYRVDGDFKRKITKLYRDMQASYLIFCKGTVKRIKQIIMQIPFYQNVQPSFYEGWHPESGQAMFGSIKIGESPFSGSLFETKELYLQSCTSSGKLLEMMKLSPKARAKLEYNNLHLINGMSVTQRYGFPILAPCTDCPDLSCVPYSSRNELGNQKLGIHFFEDDYKFDNPIWKKLDQTTYNLRNRPYLFTPDHSLYVGPLSALNISSIYKSRFEGAFWTLCGYKVIPTASWGDVDSFQYCFDGLPLNSVIAVCGVGVRRNNGALELWRIGLCELERRLHPLLIIIYGEEQDIPGLTTMVRFIPPYSKLKFQKNKI